jgi:hypothetical protein
LLEEPVRMLSAFKPKDTHLPVMFVSTHQEEGSVPVSEAKFVRAPSVEDALAYLLTCAKPDPRNSSEWIQIETHTTTQGAVNFGKYVAENFQFVEKEKQGEALYRQYYELYCPPALRR